MGRSVCWSGCMFLTHTSTSQGVSRKVVWLVRRRMTLAVNIPSVPGSVCLLTVSWRRFKMCISWISASYGNSPRPRQPSSVMSAHCLSLISSKWTSIWTKCSLTQVKRRHSVELLATSPPVWFRHCVCFASCQSKRSISGYNFQNKSLSLNLYIHAASLTSFCIIICISSYLLFSSIKILMLSLMTWLNKYWILFHCFFPLPTC